MKYVMGIDGGGTKTVCALADSAGNIQDVLYAGCSNHQICGIKQAVEVITGLIKNIAEKNNVLSEDVDFIFMGLAGADSSKDISLLSEHISKELDGRRFEIVTDIWITFASEVTDGWGAITICGTGHNCAVLTPDERKIGIMALRYTLGNYGGGRHITDKALHYAFRCCEHTGPYTALAEKLPMVCGLKTLNELANAIYASGYTFQYDFEIPKLVFELAENGDDVSGQIIRRMGEEMAVMISGLIAEAGLQNRNVNIVLGGSLLNKQDSAFLIECYRNRLKESVDAFHIHIAKKPPVLGAIFMALRGVGVKIDKQLMDELFKQISRF